MSKTVVAAKVPYMNALPMDPVSCIRKDILILPVVQSCDSILRLNSGSIIVTPRIAKSIMGDVPKNAKTQAVLAALSHAAGRNAIQL